ncbi:reverse transcriptase [Gossypium australe]|uniref:Reverse transcriptase n=1 Tax=Gossypium australe TaxID=47621 RepID=A0A5B6X244_9ROSI|nr:reverse transcriptase [Gossypium australe]
MQVLGTLFYVNWLRSSISRPVIYSPHFEISPALLTWISNNVRFANHVNEDPIAFLRKFDLICSTISYVGIPSEAIKLVLIPFMLGGKEKMWLEAFPPDTITTCNDFVQLLLRLVLLKTKQCITETLDKRGKDSRQS